MKKTQEIRFLSLRDLAVAALMEKTSESIMAYKDALEKEERKIDQMYGLLISGEADGFIQKDKKNETTGKSLIYTWTRSTRKDIRVQKTTWLCGSTGKVTALSHCDVVMAEDMYTDAAPSPGMVEGWLN